jgi:hypothetical protein
VFELGVSIVSGLVVFRAIGDIDMFKLLGVCMFARSGRGLCGVG